MSNLQQEVVCHEACDTISSERGQMKRKSPFEKPGLSLLPLLSIAVKARVMLTSNIDVADGLCDVVMGTVEK